MTLAGLWDRWRAPDGTTLKSFTIITTQANELLEPLHGRMPVLLAPDRWPAWLGEIAVNDAELKAMLRPYPGAGMTFWPVDRRVGNVRNDSPDLFAPIGQRRHDLSQLGILRSSSGSRWQLHPNALPYIVCHLLRQVSLGDGFAPGRAEGNPATPRHCGTSRTIE